MERFASYFLQSYKKCKHKHFHFLISGKPSKLSDTKNPDWVPTVGYQSILQRQLLAIHDQSKEVQRKLN